MHHKHLQELLVNFYFIHFLGFCCCCCLALVKTKEETRAEWVKTFVAKPNDQGSLPQNLCGRRQATPEGCLLISIHIQTYYGSCIHNTHTAYTTHIHTQMNE